MIIINNNPSVTVVTSAPGAKLFRASDKFKLLGLVSEIQRKLLLENSGLETHRKKKNPGNMIQEIQRDQIQFARSRCVCVCERERQRERESRGEKKTQMLGKIEGRNRTGGQRIGWLDGITDSMDI